MLNIKMHHASTVCFIISFIYSIALFATEGDGSMHRYKHFQEHKLSYADARGLAKKFNAAATNVYEKSMPLLADPALYNEEQNAQSFKELLDKTNLKHYSREQGNNTPDWMTSAEFRLWMQGRQLLIAVGANKLEQAATIAHTMQEAITPLLYAPAVYSGNSVFACWALGYLQAYYALQQAPHHRSTTHNLYNAVQYQHAHFDALTGNAKQAFFSDIMWSYAMAIQAAALANDKKAYDDYMRGFASLTNPEGTPAKSIRNLAHDQFPAWLASIVHGSALMMHDYTNTPSLNMAVDLARARSTKEQDKMLSKTTEDYYDQRLHRQSVLLPQQQ